MKIDYNKADLDMLETYSISRNENKVTHSERMRRKAKFYNVDKIEELVNKQKKSLRIGTHTFYHED